MRYGYLIVILGIIFLLASCGGTVEQENNTVCNKIGNEDDTNGEENNANGTDDNVNISGFIPTRTLSILANEMFEPIIRQAERDMAASWASRPSGERYYFHVELTSYERQDFGTHNTRLQTMLMAGQGYDMFFWGGQNIMQWSRSGFLKDIYALIDECPRTSRDDFFIQPLAAMEIDGGLYQFPLSFGFFYVFINDSLPQEFINRFSNNSTISVNDLMMLYIDLMNAPGLAFHHLDFATAPITFNPIMLLFSHMGGFIDFSSRSANLTDIAFINFLDNLRIIFPNWGPDVPIVGRVAWPIHTRQMLAEIAHESVFFIAASTLDPGLAFINPPYFTGGIPITDSRGQLFFDQHPSAGVPSTWASVCITTVGDSTLAWEFLWYLERAFSRPHDQATVFGGSPSFTSPISRDLFLPHISAVYDELYLYARAINEIDNFLYTREYVINSLMYYNEMPMALMSNQLPRLLLWEHFVNFMSGAMTAEAFARQVQNIVSLWLLE